MKHEPLGFWEAFVPDLGAGERYKPVFHGLLDRGIYVAPSAYEVMFLSLVHTPAEITRFARGLGEVLAG